LLISACLMPGPIHTPAAGLSQPSIPLPPPGREARILVVDDDPSICRVLLMTLNRAGYRLVETARDAECARAVLMRGGISVVVTDIAMPGTDGLSLMEWAQAHCPGPAWIILSGHASFSDAVRAVKLGAFDFISKPILEMESFTVAVRNALRQQQLLADQARLHAELAHRNTELKRRVVQLEDAFDLLSEQAETISQDLVRAELVQRALLPQHPPNLDAFAFDAYYRPSHKVGGDIYDVLRVDDQHAVFYVADAAGHGVSAAMVAVLFKLRLPLQDPRTGGALAPDRALAAVNKAIVHECTAPGLFITAALCLLNLQTGELLVASGGHPPVLLRHADGSAETFLRTGPALGLSADADYTAVSTRLQPGDRLLLYTDGITDPGAEGRPMDAGELQSLLGEPVVDRQRLLARLRDAACPREADATREDDVTLVLVTAGASGGKLNHESTPSLPAEAAPPRRPGAGQAGNILAGHTGAITFFSLHGRCGWAHASAFHDACRDELAAGRGLVVDFTACTFLDSTFLGTVYEAFEQTEQAGLKFAVQGLLPAVRALFEELSMERLLQTELSCGVPLPADMIPLMLLPAASHRHRRRIAEAHEAIASIDERNRERFLGVITQMRREIAEQETR